MVRAADFDLAKELGKPGFTPAGRDAPALAALIVAGEEPSATRAAPALAGLGDAGRAALEVRFADADDGAKARLVAVLGLLARGGDEAARAELIARIADPAVRVRKACTVALGKLGGDDARQVLIARWDAGDAAPEERRALAEALGKLGGDDALARLRALDAGSDAELVRRRDRAVLMADRTSRREAPSTIAGDLAPPALAAARGAPASIAIQLGCRPGLGPLLVDELTQLGWKARPIGERGAELRLDRPLAALFGSRLWATLALPFALAPGASLAAAVTRTLISPAVLAVLRGWTRGPVRWRLGFAHGHKRAVVWQVARDVTAAVPDLINDPTATTWDFVVDDEARTVALVPRRLDDPRFAYRVAEVPAASHPTVAAALARIGDARPGDRVWDPFCGSGLELVERARRGPARSLLGTDLDPGALDAARANLEAAGVHAELAAGDARSHAPGAIDLIVTNPPLGSRVQLDAAALLVAALPNFVRALAPGGRLAWITPAVRKTSPAAEQLGLVRTFSSAVDLGGVRGQLERWDRR
jgi:hypothetical protein